MSGTLTYVNIDHDAERRRICSMAPRIIKGGVPIVDAVREKLMARGGRSGFRSLRRVLQEMDQDGSKSLTKEELRHGLESYGMAPTDFEMDTLMRHFDRDGNKAISVNEFLVGLRPSFPAHRQKLTMQAFGLLESICGNKVHLRDLLELHDPTQHPAVIAGESAPEQVQREFHDAWMQTPEQIVSGKDFLDFYHDVSSGIDNDIYYELLVRNAWHMGGGVGAAACSTCRKVLVVHGDGRESVVELKNDLRVGNDTRKILHLVKQQGVVDAREVRLQWQEKEQTQVERKAIALVNSCRLSQLN